MRYSWEEREKWMDGLTAFDAENTRILMAIFSVFGVPENYLDVGCGSGIMVRTARKLKVRANGIDLIAQPEDYFFEHDLAEPFTDMQPEQFNLVTSIETAEHIPIEGADNFCDTIVRNMAHGAILVFTGAPPGQAGHNHVNCQPAVYWREKFYNRGISYVEHKTWRMALAWSATDMAQRHIQANLQVFERG